MKVIIYGLHSCKYCVAAKELCENRKIQYDYKEVKRDITVEQLREMVGASVKTVPQIFIMEDGFAEYVGGYAELAQKLSPN